MMIPFLIYLIKNVLTLNRQWK